MGRDRVQQEKALSKGRAFGNHWARIGYRIPALHLDKAVDYVD